MSLDIERIEKNFIKKEFIESLIENNGRKLTIIEKELDLIIEVEEDRLIITGSKKMSQLANITIDNLVNIFNKKEDFTIDDVRDSIDLSLERKKVKVGEFLSNPITKNAQGRYIKPKTWGQRRYIDSIRNNEVIFGIGPAGTGKTYLAMAMAADALREKKVNRIILTRPAVEAGESLGFLPGDLQDKVDPYLRPIYDALFDILGVNSFNKYMEKGLIEIAPLAYMRGRTLESSYIILDEAQNTTNEQMKMILTRLGYGSKLVVTGDITQIDLKKGQESGLDTIQTILKNINGIDFIYLSKKDIVRHKIVQKIIEAYERYGDEVDGRARNFN